MFGLNKVDAAEFPRVDTQFTRRTVHQTFQHIDRLGAASAAIGISLNCVRVIALDLQPRCLHVVHTHQNLAEQQRLNRLTKLAVICTKVTLGADSVRRNLVILIKSELGKRRQITPAIIA